MSCSSYDWKAYALGEVDPGDRHQAEAHAATCPNCREELATLRLTLDALSTLREEEIPRRIAFVSDKVFEPSPVRRFLRDFWGSAARLGFASALALAIAAVSFAWYRPAAVSDDQVARQVNRRVDAAVQKAVADTEARQVRRTTELLAASEERNSRQREADMQAVSDQLSVLQKRYNTMLLASNDFVRGTK